MVNFTDHSFEKCIEQSKCHEPEILMEHVCWSKFSSFVLISNFPCFYFIDGNKIVMDFEQWGQ